MQDLATIEHVAATRDRIRPWPAIALHATLGLPGDPPIAGDPLPPLWRWLYFLETPRRSALGPNGSAAPPAKGGIFGGGPYHWLSGRIAFRRNLIIGRSAHLSSSFDSRRRAETEDGPVEILTQRFDVSNSDGVAEIEERDYVRKIGGIGQSDAPSDAPPMVGGNAPESGKKAARWRRRWALDAPLLFRYSALTFDANRLHYDIDYCREAAGAQGLLIQTPLLATLLLDLARENGPDERFSRFTYRLRSAVTHLEAFAACCRPIKLEDGAEGLEMWIETESAPQRVVMTAHLAYE